MDDMNGRGRPASRRREAPPTTQEATMAKFLILARGTGEAYKHLSPQEMQQVIQKYMAWTEEMRKAGRLLHGEKLREGGRVVRGVNGQTIVTDGPFAESKEVLGGFWLVEASSYEQVQQDVAKNPHLRAGSLEIREIEDLSLRG
jgi:hypothetical protein